jgi:hypothetical protein
MRMRLEDNRAADRDAVPFILRVDVRALTAVGPDEVAVPVHLQPGAPRPLNVEVCGFRIDAVAPTELLRPVERLVRGLINVARFPDYVLVARRSRRIHPVYTLGDEVLATTPGGPVFRHVELARVRDYLGDYLHAVGELGAPGKSDVLHVRGVDAATLTLRRPDFYLKKRAARHDDNEFWAPVFTADDGGAIYTCAASGRREVEFSGGYEVMLLRAQVAQALQAARRLADPLDLRVDRLLPATWRRVRQALLLTGAVLVAGDVSMDIYRAGRLLLAVEHRQDERRYILHPGADLDDLRERTRRELRRRGVVDTGANVMIIGQDGTRRVASGF